MRYVCGDVPNTGETTPERSAVSRARARTPSPERCAGRPVKSRRPSMARLEVVEGGLHGGLGSRRGSFQPCGCPRRPSPCRGIDARGGRLRHRARRSSRLCSRGERELRAQREGRSCSPPGLMPGELGRGLSALVGATRAAWRRLLRRLGAGNRLRRRPRRRSPRSPPRRLSGLELGGGDALLHRGADPSRKLVDARRRGSGRYARVPAP